MKDITTQTEKTVLYNVWEDSSLLESANWSEGELVVNFKGGQTYKYLDVELEAFLEFADAESGGKHFHASIRNKYETEKIEEED
jgi:hypothetical protein